MLKAKEAYWILYDHQREMVAGTDVPIICASRKQALSLRALYGSDSNYKPLRVWLVLATPEVEA